MIVRVMLLVTVWAGEPASLTVAPKEKFPLAVGVPATPPFAAKVRPAGSVPEEIDQEYGPLPPDACSALE
jgi:hypothetical protein